MTNSGLAKALELTWENKAKFYEATKNLTVMEIVTGIEQKYGKRNRPFESRKDTSFYAVEDVEREILGKKPRQRKTEMANA